ncbi:MAG: type II/IV secretion system ATPase subunit [Methanolinea sp.]|jgi:flagellar protein FlaI|nr:type II/IV secretion system ATPase subunit [Methanolinea sp.]MDH7510683.1 type II/IV secretion system ATPase subunit [Methanolinea sp.]
MRLFSGRRGGAGIPGGKMERAVRVPGGDVPGRKSPGNILGSLFRKDRDGKDTVAVPLPVTVPETDISNGTGTGKQKVKDRYWLKKGFCYASIIENDLFDTSYIVTEPPVTQRERILLEEVHDYLRDVLIYEKVTAKEEMKISLADVRKAVSFFDPGLSDDRVSVIHYYLERNLQGYGPIDPLMHDQYIEDISCNGYTSPVFVYHTNYGSIPTNITFTAQELNRYVLKLSQKADKQVSISSPLLDAPLPDGSRAQITYTDVISSKGSSFTIRRFKSDPMTPVNLIRYGTYDPEILAYIWLAVENRKSMIIVGGTASGKTSTMNAISYFIPLTAKIVSLEDTREIQLPHKNWLPTRTRETSSQSAKGDIDLFSLLRASLRQRPEYIIVGEVRGPEAQTLFQAMNTGHTTYSTLHAGSVEESINRLVNPPINVPRAMFGALDLMVVQLLQYQEGRAVRRCLSLNEISVDAQANISYHELYRWNPRTDVFERNYYRSRVLDDIAYARGWTRSETEEQLSLRAHALGIMARKGIVRSDQVSNVFHLVRKSANFAGRIGEADAAG